jgi:beta propeller repeat protein
MPYCDIYEFSYDGSDPNKIQITTSDSYKRYAAISDNKIAWEDYRDGCWDIFIHDGLTEKRLLALNDPGGMAISADNIIFIGRRPGTDNKNVPGLYIYDIVNNVQRFLTAARPISRPSIYNDKIVWSEMSEIAAYPLPEKRIIIYLYDISNSVKMVITGLKSSERIQSDPVIYEDRIAYVYKRADGLNDIVVGIIYSMPSIRTIDIAEAAIGDIITITGENFGYKKRDSSVIFTDGVTASVYENDWTDSQIRVRVPSNAASGTLKVVTNGGDSNEVYIKVKPQPSISIELNELFWKLGKMRLGERKSNAGDMGIPMHAITNTGNVPVMIDIGYGPWAHSIIHPGYEQGQDTFVTLTERSVMPPYGRMAIMDLDPGVTRPLRLTYGAPVKLSEASDGMSAVYEIRAYLMRR